jgi:hypothetical protein
VLKLPGDTFVWGGIALLFLPNLASRRVNFGQQDRQLLPIDAKSPDVTKKDILKILNWTINRIDLLLHLKRRWRSWGDMGTCARQSRRTGLGLRK